MPEPDDKKPPIAIDFVSGAVGFRLREGQRQGQGRGQPLPRALGFSGTRTPAIVDATAGMGRDGFLLASLGASVTLIERNAEIHAALAAALSRARAHSDAVAGIVARITLIHGDSRQLLPGLAPEAVLVDPMHPERAKSALVKKGMRDLRDIVGADRDARELMEAALGSATGRVVLKWPRRAPPIAGLPKPSHTIAGKTTRYDVFVTGR